MVWRLAWDLLLTDRYSLEDICERLHEQGFRNNNSMPFLHIRPIMGKTEGEQIAHIQMLSRAFHNWFYAGWVVVENEWVNIKPKDVRGEWEPIVSTDEFERGLAILAQRIHRPMPSKRHFYLLQGLIFLKTENGLRKLMCSMPNANRARGGVAYYCVPSTATNFLCHRVDAQIPAHLQALQVDQTLMPRLCERYRSDVSRFTKNIGRERHTLEVRCRKLDEKELNLWRAFTDHGMRPQIYEQLTREIREKREKVEMLIQRSKAEQQDSIENIDAALRVLSEIGERYAK